MRGSISRPWLLQLTTPTLHGHFKYSGQLRHHLVESVIVRELSDENKQWAEDSKYFTSITEISPQRGYGFAIYHFMYFICKAPYMINWEDDYSAEVDIPLDDCIGLMEKYPHINQICFNKRETMKTKPAGDGAERYEWVKEQRYFELNGRQIPLVVREKWWFGPAIWRISFIKFIFQAFPSRVHHYFNDQVILPLAGRRREGNRWILPDAKQIEEAVGTYIFGKHEDPRMVCHSGFGQSFFTGDIQKKWKEQGYKVDDRNRE
jgi:hypothetical protein